VLSHGARIVDGMEMRGSAQGATGLYTIYSAARAPVPILRVAGPAHAHGVDAHPQCLFPLPAPPITLLFRLHPSLLAPRLPFSPGANLLSTLLVQANSTNVTTNDHNSNNSDRSAGRLPSLGGCSGAEFKLRTITYRAACARSRTPQDTRAAVDHR